MSVAISVSEGQVVITLTLLLLKGCCCCCWGSCCWGIRSCSRSCCCFHHPGECPDQRTLSPHLPHAELVSSFGRSCSLRCCRHQAERPGTLCPSSRRPPVSCVCRRGCSCCYCRHSELR